MPTAVALNVTKALFIGGKNWLTLIVYHSLFLAINYCFSVFEIPNSICLVIRAKLIAFLGPSIVSKLFVVYSTSYNSELHEHWPGLVIGFRIRVNLYVKSGEKNICWLVGSWFIIGWIDGWMVGWLDGWMVGWLDGWMVGWLDGWMVGWLDGWLVLDAHESANMWCSKLYNVYCWRYYARHDVA